MKNLMRKFLFIVAVFTSIVTTAKDGELDLKVSVLNAKAMNFVIRNMDGDLEVSIRDLKGYYLYSEKFQKTYISKKFDLESLIDGEYIIEIKGQTKIIEMPFKVLANQIEINASSETVFYKPVVQLDNEDVLISIVAGQHEFVEIALYDGQYNLLYSEDIDGEIDLKRTLNISQLMKGEYRLVLKSGDKIFKELIKKS